MNNKNKTNTTCKKRNRRKLGSRNYKNYSTEMLDIAVELIKQKSISSREAEKQFGIPRRTLLNKAKEVHMKPVGAKKKLTDAEEEKLVNVLVASGEYGFPMTKLDLKMLVFNYLKKNSRGDSFNGKMPSNTWVEQFLNRHASKLSVRTTQNIKQVRAEKGLQEMQNFFDNLEETLKDVSPSNILNFDETNLSDNPGSSKCIFRRGIKYPERILNSSKSCVSIMFTVSAAGDCLPTYVVYKASNLYSEWVDGGPDGTRYNCTKSGWFDAACFEDYFKTIILKWANNLPGPKVIICDNLSSHLNIEVVELCQKFNIRFVFLPPNSTHLTQPLDVAYFAPLKREWRKILLKYKIANPGQSTINKKHFPKLLAELLKNIKLKERSNIISGFSAAGIWPINARNVLKRLPEFFDSKIYEVDSVLLDYLQKTRSPKPIPMKRSKKLRTEPGKSVCADDILVTNRPLTSRKKPTKEKIIKDRTAEEIMVSWATDNDIYLNEITGEMKGRQVINDKKDMQSTSSEIIRCKKLARLPQLSPVVYNPARLDRLTIKIINTHLVSPAYDASTEISNVCLLDKNLKSHSQNKSFVAHDENDTPECLQSLMRSSPNVLITSNVKITPKKVKNIVKNIKLDTEVKVARKSALQMKIVSKKGNSENTNKRKREMPNVKRKKISYSETSSESDVLSIADTDDSEYATFDEYVSTCLQEMADKENCEPDNFTPPFGLTDFKYFTTGEGLKEENWVVVKYATKKSIKHFVGQVLYIKNSIPTVKFTRKVKNAKYGKVIFTYPHVEDICEVNRDDVEMVLPQPNITRRGQIMFDITFNPGYNLQ